MGYTTISKQTEPTSPSTNYLRYFMDTVDNRPKTKDYNSVVSILSQYLNNPNAIMNGGFMIQQKIAVASTAIAGITTTTRGGVVADRFAVTTDVASNLNWEQVDTISAVESGLQSRYYGSIISSTAGKKVMLSQFIISKEMGYLRSRKIRLSIKIKQKVGTTGQTYKLGLLQLTAAGTVDVSPAFLTGAWSASSGTDPVWGTNLAPITPQSAGALNGTITGNFLNITTTAGWIKSSMVITIPTDAKNLVPVIFANADGGTSDNISFSEFSISLAEDDPDWIDESFSIQLHKCQAYYNKTFTYSTVPVQNAGANTGEAQAMVGIAAAVALAGNIFWRFPTKMWKAPVTITSYSPSAASVEVTNITGAVQHTATAVVTQTGSDEAIVFTSTGNAAGTVGQRCGLHITASAEIVN